MVARAGPATISSIATRRAALTAAGIVGAAVAAALAGRSAAGERETRAMRPRAVPPDGFFARVFATFEPASM